MELTPQAVNFVVTVVLPLVVSVYAANRRRKGGGASLLKTVGKVLTSAADSQLQSEPAPAPVAPADSNVTKLVALVETALKMTSEANEARFALMMEEISVLKRDAKTSAQVIARLETGSTEINGKYTVLMARTSRLEDELRATRNDLRRVEIERDAANRRADVAQTDKEAIEAKYKVLSQRYEELSEQLSTLRIEFDILQKTAAPKVAVEQLNRRVDKVTGPLTPQES
jgi:chromosome segregation ATPase